MVTVFPGSTADGEIFVILKELIFQRYTSVPKLWVAFTSIVCSEATASFDVYLKVPFEAVVIGIPSTDHSYFAQKGNTWNLKVFTSPGFTITGSSLGATEMMHPFRIAVSMAIKRNTTDLFIFTSSKSLAKSLLAANDKNTCN